MKQVHRRVPTRRVVHLLRPEFRNREGCRSESRARGERCGEDTIAWTQPKLGLTPNEVYGQTEVSAVIGNSGTLFPVRPGSIGLEYPRVRAAVIDDNGTELPYHRIGNTPPFVTDREDFDYTLIPGATRDIAWAMILDLVADGEWPLSPFFHSLAVDTTSVEAWDLYLAVWFEEDEDDA